LEIIVLYFLSRRVVKGVYRFFYSVTKRRNWTVYLFAVVFLPGTFIHEISHFLAALFLLVPVGKLELLPKIEEEGNFKLGSVAITKTDPLRRFLIGIAPVIFGFFVIFGLLYFVSMMGDSFQLRIIDTWWEYLLIGFVIFQVANSMFASKKDLEGAIVLLIFLLVVIIFLILLGVDYKSIFTGLELNGKFLEIIRIANIFLIVPIIIDVLVLLLIHRCISS
jgi:hypothetical protein